MISSSNNSYANIGSIYGYDITATSIGYSANTTMKIPAVTVSAGKYLVYSYINCNANQSSYANRDLSIVSGTASSKRLFTPPSLSNVNTSAGIHYLVASTTVKFQASYYMQGSGTCIYASCQPILL